MSPELALVLWALVLFEAKHFACDFALKRRHSKSRRNYGNRIDLIHAGVHALGSLPAIFVLTASPALIASIAAAESVAHYHLDWFKGWIVKRRALGYDDRLYWILFGADQLGHQLTYVIILAVLARAAGL